MCVCKEKDCCCARRPKRRYSRLERPPDCSLSRWWFGPHVRTTATGDALPLDRRSELGLGCKDPRDRSQSVSQSRFAKKRKTILERRRRQVCGSTSAQFTQTSQRELLLCKKDVNSIFVMRIVVSSTTGGCMYAHAVGRRASR